MKSEKLTAGDRIEIIDVFRFLCVLAVAVFHFALQALPASYATFNLGLVGVQVFFVISGFVIAVTLERCASIGEFAWRRFVRLYPAFLAAATVTAAGTYLLGIPLVSPYSYFSNVSLAILFGSPAPYVDGVYWTLGVELKFYVCAALFWAVFGRNFWIGLLVVTALTSYFRPFALVVWTQPNHMPLFLCGVAMWLAFIEKKTAKAVILTIASVILYQANNTDLLPYNQTMIWLPVAALALGVYAVPHLSFGPAALLGKMSYSMYLVHNNLGRCLLIKLGAFAWLPFPVKVTIVIVATYCIAALLYYAVELPVAEWLRSLRARIKAEAAPSAKPLASNRPMAFPPPLGDRRQHQADFIGDGHEILSR
ncbi:acyltransferase [Hyphomicrobium sp. ghe19]|uniref:acyltransferase family protein n=1 Tax=Hyphomicrobium sp. ghe19 TaxID=2682968 RepID=UPI0013677E17|nr:hypothetical protein HYPP_03756 [Hyphomicrobium sp. ghe19]